MDKTGRFAHLFMCSFNNCIDLLSRCWGFFALASLFLWNIEASFVASVPLKDEEEEVIGSVLAWNKKANQQQGTHNKKKKNWEVHSSLLWKLQCENIQTHTKGIQRPKGGLIDTSCRCTPHCILCVMDIVINSFVIIVLRIISFRFVRILSEIYPR